MGHSTKPRTREEIEALATFVKTDNERQCIAALIEHGTYRKAARAIGKNENAFTSAVRTTRRRAAASGYAPEHGWNPPAPRTKAANTVPEGFRVKGVSDKVDQRGDRIEAWVKSERATDSDAHAPVPPDFAVKKVSDFTDAQGEIRARWTQYSPEEASRWRAFEAACKENAESYRGIALAAPRPDETDANLLSCYPIGDPHIGMLAHASETGAHFDLRIAEAQLVECLRQLVARTPPAKHALILQLGDFFHAQDNAQTTPGHGHKLDVDGRAFKVQATGHRILRSIVDLARQKHEHVTIVSLPGNHDPNMSFALGAWLSAVYENVPSVTVDPSIAPYYFHQFGVNMIAACHGDGAKEKDLPLLMAARRPVMWGSTTRRVMHAGHIHHTRVIEHSGARTWYHNTLADKDAWHSHKGYDSEQCLEAITYHEDYGQEHTATVGIERVRDALAKGIAA